jgi:hypothetical protein
MHWECSFTMHALANSVASFINVAFFGSGGSMQTPPQAAVCVHSCCLINIRKRSSELLNVDTKAKGRLNRSYGRVRHLDVADSKLVMNIASFKLARVAVIVRRVRALSRAAD